MLSKSTGFALSPLHWPSSTQLHSEFYWNSHSAFERASDSFRFQHSGLRFLCLFYRLFLYVCGVRFSFYWLWPETTGSSPYFCTEMSWVGLYLASSLPSQLSFGWRVFSSFRICFLISQTLRIALESSFWENRACIGQTDSQWVFFGGCLLYLGSQLNLSSIHGSCDLFPARTTWTSLQNLSNQLYYFQTAQTSQSSPISSSQPPASTA